MVGDRVEGTLGSNVAGAAVGQDIQQVSINLGDRSVGEIAQILADLTRRSDRLTIAVMGDAEIGAPGVVARLDKIDQLSQQFGSLAGEMAALSRALLGDSRYQSVGLVQQVQILTAVSERRERWRLISTWALGVLAISQIAQWVAVWQIYLLVVGLGK